MGKHQWLLDASHEYQQDERGFSPLLENNLTRKINKTIYRIEYAYLNQNIEPLLGIELLEQRSNLALYTTSTLMGYLGLRWTW